METLGSALQPACQASPLTLTLVEEKSNLSILRCLNIDGKARAY